MLGASYQPGCVKDTAQPGSTRMKSGMILQSVTDAHILSYFSVFYTDLFDEVFVFESLSLDMIRWLVTCCHHVHS